jgi:hypothetical protein
LRSAAREPMRRVCDSSNSSRRFATAGRWLEFTRSHGQVSGLDVTSGAWRDRWTASSSMGDRPPMDECRREGSEKPSMIRRDPRPPCAPPPGGPRKPVRRTRRSGRRSGSRGVGDRPAGIRGGTGAPSPYRGRPWPSASRRSTGSSPDPPRPSPGHRAPAEAAGSRGEGEPAPRARHGP